MEKRKRQFKGTGERRTFFDRKVRKVGYSRVLSMSKLIPEDWAWVRMRVLNKTNDAVEVLFTKLLGCDDVASDEDTSKEGE